MKILMTGGTGLIGSRFKELTNLSEVLAPGSVEFDITDKEAVESFINKTKPDILINFASLANTEEAENNHALAGRLNVDAAANLVESCIGRKIKFVQISTDFVFDGNRGNYQEDADTKAINYYGQTKLEAEKIIQNFLTDWLIVRTSYPYRASFAKKNDCVRWMLPKLKQGEKINLVYDQCITPTFVDDFSYALDLLLTKNACGVYHAAGNECLSFWDMGHIVCRVFGFDKSLINKTSYEDFYKSSKRAAKAPQRSCLNTDKLKRDFGFSLSDFENGLKNIKMQEET